jgi:two-component system NarL family sensor kinase
MHFARCILAGLAGVLCSCLPASAQTAELLLDSARHYRSQHFTKAIPFAEQAWVRAAENGQEALQAEAALIAGYSNYLGGNHDEALKWYLRAEQLYQKAGDHLHLAQLYNELIVLYSKHEKFDAGDSVSRKALYHAATAGDTVTLATAYNNTGLMLLKRGMQDSAYGHFLQAYQYYQRFNDLVGMSYSLDYMASVLSEKGDLARALEYLRQSRELKKQTHDPMGEAIITNNIGEALFQQGRYEAALTHFREAREKAHTLDFADLEGHTWQMEARVLEQQKKFDEAYAAIRQYQEIHDRILNEKRIRAIEELQTKYETDKKEQANILLQRENQVQALKLTQRNSAIVALIIVALLIAGISWLLYNRYRLRQQARMNEALMREQALRTQAVIDAEEHERQRLARELHDGVGQMLAATKRSLQSLHTGAAPGEAAEASLSLIDESIREVRQLSHEMMPPSLRNKNLVQALTELTARMRTLFPGIQMTSTDTEDLDLDKTQTLMLYRTIQEILNNAIRHAQATAIHLELVNHGDELSIMVYDDGKGFEPGAPGNSGGLGLKNIRSRVEYIGARLDLDSTPGKGTTYIIELPLQPQQAKINH